MSATLPGDDPARAAYPAAPSSPSGSAALPATPSTTSRRVSDDGDYRALRRRAALPVLLFLTTCVSTFWAGATQWMNQLEVENYQQFQAKVHAGWHDGLLYMAAVMGILLMHEMGHFIQTVRYRVPASLPLFLPLPVMMGTMGAVIVMDSSRANRKQLFDIGISGPLAGLIVAIPLIWIGIATAAPAKSVSDFGTPFTFGTPLIFKLITQFARPELTSGAVMTNPYFVAGWVGMLVTGLNMLPVSQLDGGHVIYGLFGPRAKWVARAFIVSAIAFIVITEQYNWIVMLILVILLGVDHPPTGDDSVPLGPVRWTIGIVSLLIPVFCFTPVILPSG